MKPTRAAHPGVGCFITADQDGMVLLLEPFDFTKGDWEVTIEIAGDDLSTLDPRVPAGRTLVCSDPAVLSALKKSWRFRASGGDVATVTSGVTVARDGYLLLDSGIALSPNAAGLQTASFGWAAAVDQAAFFESLRHFK